MQSLAAENLPHVFFNPCRPGFGLLGFGKMQKVRPLPPRLRMLRLRDQNALGILQQRALDKQKRTVCLECVNQYDVAFIKRIAGDAPLELLFEPAAEDYGSEQLQFFPPFYGFFNIRVDEGVHYDAWHKVVLSLQTTGELNIHHLR